MTTYAWPGWCVNRFEMRIEWNTRIFTGPYVPSVQTLDLLGERWFVSMDTTLGTEDLDAGEREAFFDRLRGPVNRIALWNLARPVPLGTFGAGQNINVVNGSLQPVTVVNAALQVVNVVGGTAVTTGAAVKGANTITVTHIAGRTLRAGDMLGINGQLVRVLANVTFSGASATVEFAPRLRADVPSNTVIVYDRPTAVFMLMSNSVPVVHRPGMYEGSSFDLIETY